MTWRVHTIGCIRVHVSADLALLSPSGIEWGAPGPASGEPDMVLQQSTDRIWPELDGVRAGPRLLLLDNGFAERNELFEIEVQLGPPVDLRIHILPHHPRHRLTSMLLHGSPDPRVLAVQRLFSYHYFWSILHLLMLSRSMGFLHAAVLDKDGAVAVCGTGGCGKSSVADLLIEHHGFDYLAEDFAIVSADGATHLSPRTIPVYEHDLEHRGTDYRARFRASQPRVSRLAWMLRSLAGGDPMRRVAPRHLYGADRLCERSTIKAGFLLVRGRTPDPRIQDLGIEQFAGHAAHASFREMRSFYEVSHQIAANLPHRSLDMRSMFDETVELYKACFAQAALWRIDLPPGDVGGGVSLIRRALG